MQCKIFFWTAFLAVAIGIHGEADGGTYSYTRDEGRGSLAASKDWRTEEGAQAAPESTGETTLKVSLRDSARMAISVPGSFTVGRIIIGEPQAGAASDSVVAWMGDQPLTVAREGGEPGEFLLESFRDKRGEGGAMTGCLVHVPLLAPNGLTFGGAGRGPEMPGNPPDLHRLTIVGGIEATGPSAKIGPAETVLSGSISFNGPLEVREGALIIAFGQRRDDAGETRFAIKSMRIGQDASFSFYSPPGEPSKPVLVFTLERPGEAPVIESDGLIKGIDLASLELQTPGHKALEPGTYRLIKRSRPGVVTAQFFKIALNGDELPPGCRMDYSPDGRTVDLVVEGN